MEKYIIEFLNYLKFQKNYSKETVKSYATDLIEYNKYLEENKINVLTINYEQIKNYLTLLDKKDNKNSTVSRKISALRSFYRYLLSNNIIDKNPFSRVSLPKKEKKLPKFFYYNELEELFNVPKNNPLGQRDTLILELLYATGVRVSELVNIKIGDITGCEIRILGKGNKERIVRFGEYAEEALNRYLRDGYHKLNIRNSEYLFLNNDGNQLTDRGVRYILDKIIKKTSIDKKISPHMLRHTFATHLLNEGCDILTVQELLGHDSLSATSIYTHVTSDRLKDVYFRTHPRAMNKKNND